MVTLDETLPAFAVEGAEVEPAGFALQPSASLQNAGLLLLDKAGIALTGVMNHGEDSSLWSLSVEIWNPQTLDF